MSSIKKNDKVLVLSGKSKGKQGKVLKVLRDKDMVLVEGVNMATKHKKPRGQKDPGGIIHQENPIHISKVMVICDKCGKPTRIGKSVVDGKKVRVCKKCKDILAN